MLRPAYLFSTVALAAIASQLPDDMIATTSPAALSVPSQQVVVQPLQVRAQTISGEVSRPAQSKRWVF